MSKTRTKTIFPSTDLALPFQQQEAVANKDGILGVIKQPFNHNYGPNEYEWASLMFRLVRQCSVTVTLVSALIMAPTPHQHKNQGNLCSD